MSRTKSTIARPRLRRDRLTGTVEVGIKTPRGLQWISTGTTSLARARQVVDATVLDRLQLTATANALTADAVGRLLTGRRSTSADILDAWRADPPGNHAPDTLANYDSHLRAMLAELGVATSPLAALRRPALRGWVNAPGVPAGTRRLRLSAARSYYRFANAAGFCVGNPALLIAVDTRDLVFTEIEPRETLPITPEEYALLMASPRVTGFWRAAIPLGFWLTLSIRDAACLEWASLRGNAFVYYRKKTGKRIQLPLDDPLLGAGELSKVFLGLLDHATSDSPFCFPREKAIALDPKKRAKLSVRFQRLLAAHGIVGKRFHSLRHAGAVRLKNAGKTLEEIGSILGHESIVTTKIYTDHAPTP